MGRRRGQASALTVPDDFGYESLALQGRAHRLERWNPDLVDLPLYLAAARRRGDELDLLG